MDLATVRVKHPELPGGMLINEVDFNPAEHEPADEASALRCAALVAEQPVVVYDHTTIINNLNEASAAGAIAAGATGLQTSATGTAPAAREARQAELEALKFVELKEIVADLGVTIVPVGTTKESLVIQILDLEEQAGK